MNEVRSTESPPTLDLFRAAAGTPLVVDIVAKAVYALMKDQTVAELGARSG